MRALFCGGSEKSGSWAMRAVQIAAQRADWKAVSAPSREEIAAADVIVAVKRVKPGLANLLRTCGRPVIWDALDFWKQPDDAKGVHTVAQAVTLAKPHIEALQPRAIIAANRTMAIDLMGRADVVACIHHHYRLDAVPVSGDVLTYDGAQSYLGGWASEAAANMREIGWGFRLGQPDAFTGALFAVRGGEHGSWLAQRWKSNVKAANAIGYGVPLLAWPEHAYLETLPDTLGLWFDSAESLTIAAHQLRHEAVRRRAAESAEKLRPMFSVQAAAAEYEALFRRL